MFSSKEKAREYHKKWYNKNKQRRIELNRKWQTKQKKVFNDYKKTLSCYLCGESDHRCLDFHHKHKERKRYSIARGMSNNVSISKLMKEIKKCVPICANCHRKLHYLGE